MNHNISTLIVVIFIIIFLLNKYPIIVIPYRKELKKIYNKEVKDYIGIDIEMGRIIPKTIYLTYKTRDTIPDKVFDNWKKLNPEYTIEFYDDNRAIAFLTKFFDPIVSEAFRNIPYGPIKSDLWRLCILYVYGGVYADIDIYPIKPLKYYVKDDLTFITVLSYRRLLAERKDIVNAFIASVKRNPILKECINLIIAKYLSLNRNYGNTKRNKGSYWFLSGVSDMYFVISKMLNEKMLKPKIYYTKDQKILLLQEVWPLLRKKKSVFIQDDKGTKLFYMRYPDYNEGW